MGNVASIYLRIFAPTGTRPPVGAREMFNALFGSKYTSGDTFGVPVSLTYGENRSYIDLVYGSRWSPGNGPHSLWQRMKDQMENVFVRFYDGGGDHDQIYSICDPDYGSVDPEERVRPENERWRPCRYLFDEIDIELKPEHRADEFETFRPKQIADRCYRFVREGSYLGSNPRTAWHGMEIVQGEPHGALASESFLGPAGYPPAPLPPLLAQVLDSDATERVRLYWRGRLIHDAIRPDTFKVRYRGWDRIPEYMTFSEWMHLSYCGWDNCGDAEYLDYIEQRSED